MGRESEKDIIITGSKGKGGGGSYRTPVEQPDTLQSTQIVTIVDAISEGPIEGLVDGDKGIALNYTPLRTPEGTLTYQNVSWDSRLGTPDQEAYTDIAGAEAEQSVGVEVTNLFPKKVGPGSGSVTRQVNNTNCTHVRITLMVQGLYEQKMSGDNVGDTVAASVSYRIQIRNNLGVIIADTSETKTDKTTSSAQWYLKFALDRNGPWTITVSKTSEDSDQSNIKTDLYWSSYTEIIGYPLVYPHTATVLLRGSAETFGGSVPSRAYHVKGLRIEVPSNYDPETRAYTGIWDGTFKTAWTDNPAWILRDLIQSNRYGLRKFFPPARQGQDLIDKWTLYQLAQYCDQLVPDGENGSEPRYTFNAQIMGSGEAREVIQSIASVFHGMTYWSSGMIFARADMPADPVKLISQANVIDGMLTYSTGSAQERHSVALVTWYDPDDYGRARVEPVYDWDAYQRYGDRPVQVTAYGCTSRGQAYRQGLWTLLTEDEQWQCTVEVGLDCYDLLPGDFVKVADPTAMGVRYTGRIKSVPNNITFVLDAPVTLDANETYTLSLTMPDGTIETRDITTRGTTDTVVVRSAFSALPVEWGVWMISGSDAAPRLFAVRSITEKGGDSTALELSLREVHLTKYAQLEGELILPETPGRISKRSLGVPSGLNVAETTYSSNGFPVQRLTFSWAANGDAETALYEPQYKAPNGQWTNFQPQKLFSVEVPVAAAGEYLFRVRSVATDGRFSAWAEISHTSTGTTTLPKPVTNLHAQGGQYSVLVSWTLPQDALAGYYEVWYSDDDSVGNAQLVAKIYADNFTVSGLDASTPYWFWVRSVSITGLLGEMVGPVGGVTEAVRPPDIPAGAIERSMLADALRNDIDLLADVAAQVQPLSEKLETAVPTINAITPFLTVTLPKMERAEELLAKTVAANAVDVFNDRKTAEQGFADVSQRISTEVSTLNGSIASVETDVLTKYNEHSALITSAQTAISNEAEARAAGDSTLQATLQGEIDTNTAAIAQTQEAVSSISGSHATEMRTVYARIAENAEAAALDSVDVFNAQAKENRRIALVQQTIDTSVDEINGSIATLRTDVISKYDAAAARITETQQTIANNEYARVKDSKELRAQVEDNFATINEVKGAIVKPGGPVTALYTLRANVNGHITGFGLSNDGAQSDFAVVADRFLIVGPNDTGRGTQVFTVDASTGAVVINGNLFVDSAGKANSGWIRGSMIYAGSVIELANGAIVLDGQHGTVSVFDPDAPTSGTFTEISHGRVNQYVNGNLARSLTGIETGTCSNNTWVELTGRYTTLPRIIVSPQNLQCFNSGYASQSQSFLCGVSATESLGANRWRFKPLAQLVAASGTTVIPGPASVVVQCENTSTPITYETNEVNTGENTIHIQCDAVLGGSVWSYFSSTTMYYNYHQAKMKARLCYRKTSTQAWTYCNWSAEQTLTYEQNVTVQLGASVPSGNYQVKVQFLLNAGSVTNSRQRAPAPYQLSQVPCFIITKTDGAILSTGQLNYIAIGR